MSVLAHQLISIVGGERALHPAGGESYTPAAPRGNLRRALRGSGSQFAKLDELELNPGSGLGKERSSGRQADQCASMQDFGRDYQPKDAIGELRSPFWRMAIRTADLPVLICPVFCTTPAGMQLSKRQARSFDWTRWPWCKARTRLGPVDNFGHAISSRRSSRST